MPLFHSSETPHLRAEPKGEFPTIADLVQAAESSPELGELLFGPREVREAESTP